MNARSIMPRNKEGNLHGYCEYYGDDRLIWKGVKVDGYCHGYFEDYNKDGGVNEFYAGYYLADYKVSEFNEQGYCYIWCRVVV